MSEIRTTEVTVKGLAGGNVSQIVLEAFHEFYTGKYKDAEVLRLVDLNGIRVTFTRSELLGGDDG